MTKTVIRSIDINIEINIARRALSQLTSKQKLEIPIPPESGH